MFSHFDHQTFTATVDRAEPKSFNCSLSFLTLATFHMFESGSAGFVRPYGRKVSTEKISPPTKGLFEK